MLLYPSYRPHILVRGVVDIKTYRTLKERKRLIEGTTGRQRGDIFSYCAEASLYLVSRTGTLLVYRRLTMEPLKNWGNNQTLESIIQLSETPISCQTLYDVG